MAKAGAGESKEINTLTSLLSKTVDDLQGSMYFFNWVMSKKLLFILDSVKLNVKSSKKKITQLENSCAFIYSYITTWLELYLLCFPDVSSLPNFENLQNFVLIILNMLEDEEEEFIRMVMIYKLGLLGDLPPMNIESIAKHMDIKESVIRDIITEFTQDIVVECRNSMYLMSDYIGNKKGVTRFGKLDEFKEL